MASPSPPPRTREPSMPSDPGVLAIHARYYHKHMLQPAVDKLNLLLVNPRPTRCFDPRTPTPSPMAPSVSRLTSAPPSRRPSPAAPRANNRANPVPMHRMITRSRRRQQPSSLLQLDTRGKAVVVSPARIVRRV